MPALETMSVRQLLTELARIADAMRATPASTDPRGTEGSTDAVSPTRHDLARREERIVAALRRRRDESRSPHCDLRPI